MIALLENHSENRKWVPIGKGYTNPTLEMPRRKFQKGTPGKILTWDSGPETSGNVPTRTSRQTMAVNHA